MRPFLTSVIRYVESWLFQRKPESKALHCVIPIFDFRSNKKGFTLIELVIFIVVGAIILPASFVAFTAAIKHFSTPDYNVKARFFAEQKVEEITRNTFDSVSIVNQSYNPISGYTNYQWKWMICNTGSNEINLGCSAGHSVTADYSYYKRIEVTILMPDSSTYDVYTLITKRPKS
jgi:hypothetical protein